jgi:4-hydroxy-2-oxoglutarate aldolase
MQLTGVFAPICTPFQDSGDIHHEALRQNIARYVQAGLKGFVVGGSTGEAPLLSAAEKQQIFQTVREAADDRVLIAGVGAESVRETSAMIEHAAALGYDAALVLTPHFYRSQMLRAETQTAFFLAVADSSPIPIIIYNFPQMTGIDLALDVAARLAEHPNIVAMKESSADLSRIGQLIAILPETFPVFVGASPKFHDCLRLGATGGILAIANAAPRAALLIYDSYRSGDIAASAAYQRQIAEAAGVAPRFGIQGLKYGMDLMGYFGGTARLPLLPLDHRQKAEIEALFSGLKDSQGAPGKAQA